MGPEGTELGVRLCLCAPDCLSGARVGCLALFSPSCYWKAELTYLKETKVRGECKGVRIVGMGRGECKECECVCASVHVPVHKHVYESVRAHLCTE